MSADGYKTTCAGCGKEINTAQAFRGESLGEYYCAAPCPGQHQQFVDVAMGRVSVRHVPGTKTPGIDPAVLQDIEAAIGRKG